jgi:uncharacterized protein (TIGR03067 family)
MSMSLVLACGLLMGSADDDATKKEYARFEGVWSFALVEVEGTKQPEAPFKTNKLIIWSDGRFIVVQGPRITRGSFKLDVAKTPKHIDLTITEGPAKGQKTSAIYELEGDTYTICGSFRSKERPAALSSKPDSGTILQVLKREKQPVKDARIEVGFQEMTGTWEAVSYALDGEKATDEDLKKIRLTIDAHGMAKAFREGQTFIASTMKIDTTVDPMNMDLSFTEGEPKGKSALGIYKIEDDLLTICRAAPGKTRPTGFASNPGSGQTLMSYRREKAPTTEKVGK